MLKKEYRLTSGSLSNPKNLKRPLFNLKLGRNSLEINRFAFIISKKVDPRATQRNALRRKVRSCIEEIFDNIKPGNDFIFYPNALAKDKDRAEILEELTRLFKENNLLK
ncbi:MAG: ribonuclease P protein component [Candidatus Levybacteria bacterium]|nr:ribonuclease P protein component [Candidatus Levybacteria bacterium]